MIAHCWYAHGEKILVVIPNEGDDENVYVDWNKVATNFYKDLYEKRKLIFCL